MKKSKEKSNEEINEKSKNTLRQTKKEITSYHNLRDAAKTILRGKFIAIKA